MLSGSKLKGVKYPVVDTFVDKGKTTLDELQDDLPIIGFLFAGLKHPDKKLIPLI